MSVASHLTLRRMPTGRHAFSLALIRALAAEANLAEVVRRAERALEQARTTLALELRWVPVRANRSKARTRGRAALIDNRIDEQIVALVQKIRSERVGDADDPIVALAEELLTELFNGAITDITQQSFEVQLGIMDAMMERFENDFARHVEALGLRRQLDRLAKLIEEFRAELAREDAATVSFDQVNAARNRLHDFTCKVEVAVLFLLDDDDDEATVRLREKILRPLYFQQERVAEARRRQRPVTDVDPTTGEELPDAALEPSENVEAEPAEA